MNKVMPDRLKEVPYPIAVVTTTDSDTGRFYGQAVVWVTQVSYEPLRFVMALGKTRYTPTILDKSGICVINWIDDPNIAKIFGRQSGRTVDKFAQLLPWQYELKEWFGVKLPFLTTGKYSVICKVKRKIEDTNEDLPGTHNVYLLAGGTVYENDGRGFLNYEYGSL